MRKQQKDEDYEPTMPELQADHLVRHLFEMGPLLTSGGYASPVSFQEMESWQRLTGIELQPWEAQFIHRLSTEYLGETQRAEKIGAAEPQREIGQTSIDHGAVARALQEQMKALARL